MKDTKDIQKFSTGCKGFDRYCDLIMIGNVESRGQTSKYIRPKNDCECNDFHFDYGVLRKTDMDYMGGDKIPRCVREFIDRQTEQVILYRFWHKVGKKQIVHGYIVTADDAHGNTLLFKMSCGPTYKSSMVLDWVKDYISEPAKEKVG